MQYSISIYLWLQYKYIEVSREKSTGWPKTLWLPILGTQFLNAD